MRSDTQGWDEPIPLDARPLPPFPVERLGELGEFVTATAASLQVPVDLVAFAALATISTATGGRRLVRVKADWHESLALYLAALADSSEKKTPALNAAAAPLREIEDDLIEAARPHIEAVAQEIRITQGQMAKAEQKAAGDKPDNALADAEAARAKLLELGEQPELPRLLIRDATLEAIAKVMHGQGGRVGLLASEGGLIKVAGGLYGANGKANTDLLLEAYTGSPYTIDRAGRSSARMSSTFLAVGLIIQPGVLAGLEKKNPEFRENGLLGRFLYGKPAPTAEDTFDSPPVPFAIADAYGKRIRALVERVWNREAVTTLDLDADARALFGEFYNGFAKRRKPGGDLHEVADWAGKFRGQLIRVAACLTVYENPEATSITKGRIADVLAMAPYFIAHAKAVFDLMGADGEGRLGPLRDVLTWLRGRPDAAAPFTARQAWQALKGRKWAREMEDMSAALGELEDYGWISFVPPPERPGVRGRKPSPMFEVHPWVHTPPTGHQHA
ncbi:YfjI family protein [Kitasatospora sp. NPDC051914]|uniref:YfjI family protein n=1 Tax=Kitasatospora sp. NPDC051914 TaxID=3154945 RepID=UPI00341F1905